MYFVDATADITNTCIYIRIYALTHYYSQTLHGEGEK